MIWGWGVAQYPYLLPQKLTIADAAAPSATLTGVLIVFGVAVVLVLPAIALLYTLAQRNLIEETSRPTLQRPRDDGRATSISEMSTAPAAPRTRGSSSSA